MNVVEDRLTMNRLIDGFVCKMKSFCEENEIELSNEYNAISEDFMQYRIFDLSAGCVLFIDVFYDAFKVYYKVDNTLVDNLSLKLDNGQVFISTNQSLVKLEETADFYSNEPTNQFFGRLKDRILVVQ